MADILEVCRTALRRSTTQLDETEILPLIAACKAELRAAGVERVEDTDALVIAAARLYVLANVERDERLGAAYEHLKCAMALNADYRWVGC